MLRTSHRRNGWLFVRELFACLLLAITLGTATHRHGNIGLAHSSSTAVSPSGSTDSSSTGSQADCSICQLHQQLRISLIHSVPPVDVAAGTPRTAPTSTGRYH